MTSFLENSCEVRVEIFHAPTPGAFLARLPGLATHASYKDCLSGDDTLQWLNPLSEHDLWHASLTSWLYPRRSRKFLSIIIVNAFCSCSFHKVAFISHLNAGTTSQILMHELSATPLLTHHEKSPTVCREGNFTKEIHYDSFNPIITALDIRHLRVLYVLNSAYFNSLERHFGVSWFELRTW
jgi:hypothetical protein